DEFIYGRVARVSREAPVLILQYDSTEILPGGAGNAANNVCALGARARMVGLLGRDHAGKRLMSGFTRIDGKGILRPAGYETPVKTRILAGGVHSAKQQIVRIDRVVSTDYDRKTLAAFEKSAMSAASDADAILLSDYGTGLVTPALAAALRKKTAARPRRRPVPILVDSRYNLLRYRGLTACTPNESEVEQLLDVRIGDDIRVLERAGRKLLKRTRMQAVLITRGSRGMALFEVDRPTVHVRIFGSDEVADVTGAGDTVIAAFALALAAGASSREAAHLANHAGGIVVMKRGTATVSRVELAASVAAEGDPAGVFSR
ncbi:MAG: bifunctional hydroxymethylpyrimidine kinase/phosphomethylpyrimidine kinase, partial [Acidobacteria bacterium]|nr:bifunctional hydroxymethylpyrimidine kinase/phosphomethylpyrimidine kinase [Acidobacteriota bacterium]